MEGLQDTEQDRLSFLWTATKIYYRKYITTVKIGQEWTSKAAMEVVTKPEAGCLHHKEFQEKATLKGSETDLRRYLFPTGDLHLGGHPGTEPDIDLIHRCLCRIVERALLQ